MSYAQLTTDFTTWIKRTDMVALLPRFLAMVEARFNRDLRVRQMEADLSGVIDVNGEIALPGGFLAVKSLWPDAYPRVYLTAQTLDTVKATPLEAAPPTLYAVTSDALVFNGAGTVTGKYYQTIPSLQTAGTNWLETLSPELYLAATLSEAKLYEEDIGQAAAWGARADALLSQVQAQDDRDRFSGPLTARKR